MHPRDPEIQKSSHINHMKPERTKQEPVDDFCLNALWLRQLRQQLQQKWQQKQVSIATTTSSRRSRQMHAFQKGKQV